MASNLGESMARTWTRQIHHDVWYSSSTVVSGPTTWVSLATITCKSRDPRANSQGSAEIVSVKHLVELVGYAFHDCCSQRFSDHFRLGLGLMTGDRNKVGRPRVVTL